MNDVKDFIREFVSLRGGTEELSEEEKTALVLIAEAISRGEVYSLYHGGGGIYITWVKKGKNKAGEKTYHSFPEAIKKMKELKKMGYDIGGALQRLEKDKKAKKKI